MKRPFPARGQEDIRLHHDLGICGPECALCPEGEDRTPEGLRWHEEVSRDGSVSRRVVQELGPGDEVIFEERWTSVDGTAWEGDGDPMRRLAQVIADLTKQLEELREQDSGDSRGRHTFQIAKIRRNLKAAKRRLVRFADERQYVVVELPDAAERRLVREVLDQAAHDVDLAAAEPGDVVDWLHTWIDPYEIARLTLDCPKIVSGPLRPPLCKVLEDAAQAFRFSLFRLTVSTCRTVVEDAVETMLIRLEASSRLSGDNPPFKAKVECLREVPGECKTDVLWLWDQGKRAIHEADAEVSEIEAREALVRTKRALETLADLTLLP